MHYLGEDIPKLGFGLMRLPKLDDDTFDIEQIKQMVDLFLSSGLTYFDTARAYTGSEQAIREALVERYPRDSYQIATKNAAWIGAKTADDAKDYMRQSLEATGLEYFDYYLLHNMGDARTAVFDKFDLWNWARRQKEEGRIRHLGFSAHCTADELDELLDKHPDMEFVQLQINYADWDDDSIQSRRCFEVAKKHGKPVIVMEPVRGGTLATPPDAVSRILKQADPDASLVSWALRFVWGLEGTITVLSGMSSLDQMRENIDLYRRFEKLTDDELGTLEEAQRTLASLRLIPCTACKYCMKDCPQNINIAGAMDALNRESSFPGTGTCTYGFAVGSMGKASDCIECGQCEEACPQHIDIMWQLKKAVEQFE